MMIISVAVALAALFSLSDSSEVGGDNEEGEDNEDVGDSE